MKKPKPAILQSLDKQAKLVILDRAIVAIEDVRVGELCLNADKVQFRAQRLADALGSLKSMRAELLKS
jgi:hypothetical protein